MVRMGLPPTCSWSGTWSPLAASHYFWCTENEMEMINEMKFGMRSVKNVGRMKLGKWESPEKIQKLKYCPLATQTRTRDPSSGRRGGCVSHYSEVRHTQFILQVNSPARKQIKYSMFIHVITWTLNLPFYPTQDNRMVWSRQPAADKIKNVDGVST